MSSATVMLSGGQDSTTRLYWALKEFSHVEAIGFDYGQKHLIELEVAQEICHNLGISYTVIDLKGVFANSSLVDYQQDISAQHTINPDLPSSFTAGRNAVFLSVTAGFDYNKSINNIVTGVCQTDYSGYPDCRRVFINSMEKSLSLALDSEIKIHTPLMYLTKAETWKMAKDLGCLEIIIHQTHTDYNGNRTDFNEWGYGTLDNPASQLRAKGYQEAKAKGWI
ncbi:TPA: 7-cyano-7-deazaguanine synthase QueC [Candidatus Poribacteria bacterium]|nr:7-cyano-7-deazaguanine synthase QueC [Candidatus Poribacteria bacterium]HIB89362.1 7-cyano-7-deazaguanine synthase QueC [Candidatus Poribacteria bacterium]HIC02064.1 7-cyano-7-deazaguanine synthase QueC [Candidatus Poribacteria bacterium]HIO49396.1 7-cyano-7-deazaguanine synthase QueC [Candidatus Poribacteria bacterium]HIO81412.1 7-cyano-7-deazaguanine synthase QueC [Candidatus Poribacteria bacterium]